MPLDHHRHQPGGAGTRTHGPDVGALSVLLPGELAGSLKKEAELPGQTPPDYQTEGDIKKGFVHKRVPHITLKPSPATWTGLNILQFLH